MSAAREVDHRKLVDYFTGCIEAENRARGSFRLDGSVLQLPRGDRPPLEWADLPDDARTTKWLRDLGRSADRQTVNLGWPLVTSDDEVAPVFVFEADLDADRRRVRCIASTISLSPAALRLARFDDQEIDSLLLQFETLDDLDFSRLAAWIEQIGLGDADRQRHVRQSTVVFAGDDFSAITFFLLKDLAALRRLGAGGALGETALGGLLGISGPDPDHSWIPSHAPLPTNLPQERAVQGALTQRLTLVTGPPGTGKSQVLVNAAAAAVCRGETVLIASRNNHAIDVVADRLRSIDRAVVLPRIGKKSLRAGTAQTMLGALDQATPGAPSSSDELQERWQQVARQLEAAVRHLQARTRLEEEIAGLENEIAATASALPPDLRDVTVDRDPGPDFVRESLVAAKERQTEADTTPNRWFWQRRRYRAAQAEALTAIRRTTALVGPSAAPVLEDFLLLESRQQVIDAIRTLLKLDRLRSDLRTRSTELALVPDDDAVEKQVQAVPGRHEVSIGILARTLSQGRGPGTTASRGARGFADGLAQVAAAGKGVGALPARFPGALDAFPVWVTTTLTASSLLPPTPGLFDLVIIDEAGQADFPSAMPLLMRAKRAMIVGDPRQLTHITSTTARADEHHAERAGLNPREQADFNYVANSLYGVVSNRIDGDPVFLRNHHRSQPEIISISNRLFYGERLRIRTQTRDIGLEPVEWVVVNGTFERGPGDRSAKNLQEAHEAARLADELIGAGLSVGIVSPFRAQVDVIRRLVGERHGDRVTIDTAHGFQGDERDAVVLSLVVTEGAPEFLWAHAGNPNLVNVSITRPRAVLRIVGDLQACQQSRTHLRDLATSMPDPDRWDAYAAARVTAWGNDDSVIWTSEPSGPRIAEVGEWVITAHNPFGQEAGDDANARANADLRDRLEQRGHRVWPALGESPDRTWAEPSLATDAPRDEVLALAAEFGQDAVFRITPDTLEVIDRSGRCRTRRSLVTPATVEHDGDAEEPT